MRCYLDTSLGSAPSKDDLRRVLFAVANVQGQLIGVEPLSPRLLEENPRANYPRSIHNATRIARDLMIGCGVRVTADGEFVGVIDHTSESFFVLLDQGSEVDFDLESSDGSHHPSHDCQANPAVNAPGSLAAAGVRSDPPLDIAQVRLQTRRLELEEARYQLATEEAAITCKLQRQSVGGRARAMARGVNQHIVNDDLGHLQFARAG